MGGSGSGRYPWGGNRITADSSLKLDIGYMQRTGKLYSYHQGSLSWSMGGEPVGFINYETEDLENNPTLTLAYHINRNGEREEMRYPIELLKTPAHFGGYAYWLFCPINNCRSGKLKKLYLPPGGKYFGCRKCYNLTYQSCNDSKVFDRFFRSLAKWEKQF